MHKKIILVAIIGALFQNSTYCAQQYNQATADLFKAIIDKGDIEQVEKALQDGADINAVNQNIRTPFLEALNYKRFKIADILIDAGANIYYQPCRPIFIMFTDNSDFNQIKALFNKGFNKNWQYKDGNTWAHFAAWEAFPKTLQLLLNEGVRTDLKNKDNKTVFTIGFEPEIAQSRHSDVVKARAQVEEILKDYQEKMALHKAAMTHEILPEFPTGVSEIVADATVGPLTPGQKQELQRQIEEEGKQQKADPLKGLHKKIDMLKEELQKYMPTADFNAFMKKLEST